jgi:hypothetical protein
MKASKQFISRTSSAVVNRLWSTNCEERSNFSSAGVESEAKTSRDDDGEEWLNYADERRRIEVGMPGNAREARRQKAKKV